jgi:hypothetical protein
MRRTIEQAPPAPKHLDRRQVIAGMGALAAASVLAACSQEDRPSDATVLPVEPTRTLTQAEADKISSEWYPTWPSEFESSSQETILASRLIEPRRVLFQGLHRRRGYENFLSDEAIKFNPNNPSQARILDPRLTCYMALYGVPTDEEITGALNNRDVFCPEYLAYCEALAYFRVLIKRNYIDPDQEIENIPLWVFPDFKDEDLESSPKAAMLLGYGEEITDYGGASTEQGPLVFFSQTQGQQITLEEISHHLAGTSPRFFEPVTVHMPERGVWTIDATGNWSYKFANMGGRQSTEDLSREFSDNREGSFRETVNYLIYSYIAAMIEEDYRVRFINRRDPRIMSNVMNTISAHLAIGSGELIWLTLNYSYPDNLTLALAQLLGGRCQDRVFQLSDLSAGDDPGVERMKQGLVLMGAMAAGWQDIVDQQCSLNQ